MTDPACSISLYVVHTEWLRYKVKFSKYFLDPHGIQSSKATGEPPLVLANSVFFAIRDAVKEARKESGLMTGGFKFDSPASEAEVQLACGFDPNKAL